MAPVDYREALPTDIPAISQLRSEGWGSEEYWASRVTGYINGTSHPQKALAPRVVYVAERDGSIVGFIAGHLTRRYDCDGELQWIDITSACRRSGIATGLLKHLARWFDNQGAKYICVDVDPGNLVGRAFYRRSGAVDLNEHWLVWKNLPGALLV